MIFGMLIMILVAVTTRVIEGQTIPNRLKNYTSETKTVLDDKTTVLVRELDWFLTGDNGVDSAKINEDATSILDLLDQLGDMFETSGELINEQENITNSIKNELDDDKLDELEEKLPHSVPFLDGEYFDVYDCKCTAFGDPHLTTFDGKSFTLREVGKYHMIETSDLVDARCHFSVQVDSEQIPGAKVPYVTKLYLQFKSLDNSPIELLNDMTARFKGNILNTTTPMELNKDIVVQEVESKHVHYIRVTNPSCKINIVFKKKRGTVFITVKQERYGGRISGMCGDCDDNARNDKTDFEPIKI